MYLGSSHITQPMFSASAKRQMELDLGVICPSQLFSALWTNSPFEIKKRVRSSNICIYIATPNIYLSTDQVVMTPYWCFTNNKWSFHSVSIAFYWCVGLRTIPCSDDRSFYQKFGNTNKVAPWSKSDLEFIKGMFNIVSRIESPWTITMSPPFSCPRHQGYILWKNVTMIIVLAWRGRLISVLPCNILHCWSYFISRWLCQQGSIDDRTELAGSMNMGSLKSTVGIGEKQVDVKEVWTNWHESIVTEKLFVRVQKKASVWNGLWERDRSPWIYTAAVWTPQWRARVVWDLSGLHELCSYIFSCLVPNKSLGSWINTACQSIGSWEARWFQSAELDVELDVTRLWLILEVLSSSMRSCTRSWHWTRHRYKLIWKETARQPSCVQWKMPSDSMVS